MWPQGLPLLNAKKKTCMNLPVSLQTAHPLIILPLRAEGEIKQQEGSSTFAHVLPIGISYANFY